MYKNSKISAKHHCKVDVNAKHESVKIDQDHHCNVNVYTNFSDFERQSFFSNNYNYGDESANRNIYTLQRQTAQPTAPSMAVNEDLPPSYEEVVGGGAVAATTAIGSPPAYSEMPKEGETTIASNLSGSTTNSLSNNLRRR